MYRIRTCRCACCQLDMDIAVDVERPRGAPVCTRCRLHRDDEFVGNQDHAAMYRLALAEAQDETSLIQGERDFYRERSVNTAKNAETLIGVLTRLDDLHHDRGARCSCGETSCPVLDVLAEPAVSRLIGTYDEHQQTLYELRRANPDAWSHEWDYIDVTLVYPPRSDDSAGRHRAAG